MIRTLVVDDDFMVAEVHRGFVARMGGFEVVGVAHSSREALMEVDRLKPDLVILDVFLPDRSGLSVLQELPPRRTAVDVIVVTAARDVASLQQAMQGGVLHYIVKPFDFARFERTLQSYRRFREARDSREVLAQADVDRLYNLIAGPPAELPKGLNRPTLDLVTRYLLREQSARSAQQVAEGTGISRATARRYLEYLESRGEATLELRYGSAGRPEHLYRAATSSPPP